MKKINEVIEALAVCPLCGSTVINSGYDRLVIHSKTAERTCSCGFCVKLKDGDNFGEIVAAAALRCKLLLEAIEKLEEEEEEDQTVKELKTIKEQLELANGKISFLSCELIDVQDSCIKLNRVIVSKNRLIDLLENKILEQNTLLSKKKSWFKR